MENTILNGPDFAEAQKKAIKFLIDEKYMIILHGKENRSKRESLRISRRNLTIGKKPGPKVVLYIMSLLGYGISFEKNVKKV